MASGSYVIAMTGPGDTQEGMERLVQAVMEIEITIMPCSRASLARFKVGSKRPELLIKTKTFPLSTVYIKWCAALAAVVLYIFWQPDKKSMLSR